jgi:hypothetical protein
MGATEFLQDLKKIPGSKDPGYSTSFTPQL